jgi:L-fuculose-phosphate aldolase
MTEYSLIANKIAEIGRRLYDKGMIAGMDGNISARFGGNIMITPSGRGKGLLLPSDLVIIDETGRVISGDGAPSSETAMHLTIYRSRPDIQACVHAHPPYATAFAVAGVALDSDILPEVVLVVGEIPSVDYAPTGTDLLGEAIAGHIADHDALLLKNHGVVTVGGDLEEAYIRMETIEHFAQILHHAKQLGEVGRLDRSEMQRLRNLRANFRRVRT